MAAEIDERRIAALDSGDRATAETIDPLDGDKRPDPTRDLVKIAVIERHGVNGNIATLFVNDTWSISYTYPWHVVDGINIGLDYGIVGVGANNSISSFDNVIVQVPSPQTTRR